MLRDEIAGFLAEEFDLALLGMEEPISRYHTNAIGTLEVRQERIARQRSSQSPEPRQGNRPAPRGIRIP